MILHIDMDAFFAAVEQRDNPSLWGKPVIISGRSKRGVVSTASYEARKFGIHSAMPVFQAEKKCDQLILVPGNMEKYRANSVKIMQILSHYSPVVEQVSIDEAYMDIRGTQRLFGTPGHLAGLIKRHIWKDLSLTCSIGIAPLKFLAKIASDMKKPDGLTIIAPSEVQEVIENLPIEKVPGVGKRAMKQMEALQISSLGDIKKLSGNILKQKFGKMGNTLNNLANGIDPSPVQTENRRKSFSSETTLPEDINDSESVKNILLDLSQQVGRQVRMKHLACRTVSIKIKFSDFSQITRSHTLENHFSSSTAIFNLAVALYNKKIKLKKKIRLIGVGVSGLSSKDAPYQMQLLATREDENRQWEAVDNTVDSIGEKFGTNIINKASLTGES